MSWFLYVVLSVLIFSGFVREVFGNTVICPQVSGANISPVFDSGSGYCVVDVLDERGGCPSGYVFSPAMKKCVAVPLCAGTSYWDAREKRCVSVSVSGGGEGGGFSLDPNKAYCAVDRNGDGEVGSDEIFECQRTQQGWLCPQNRAECRPEYITPTCPSGYQYNSATGKCEAGATPAFCSSYQVPVTNYLCPVNNQIYSDLNTCNSACMQVASCSQHPISFSGGINFIDPYSLAYRVQCGLATIRQINIIGNGNQLVISWVICRYSSFFLPGGIDCRTISGSLFSNTRFYGSHSFTLQQVPYEMFFGVIANGNSLVFHFVFDRVTYNFPITVEGANFGYSAIITPWRPRSVNPNTWYRYIIQPSGNGLYVYFTNGFDTVIESCGLYTTAQGTIPNSGVLMSCPLGNYPCYGNPPVCSIGQSCVTHSSSVTRWRCSVNNVEYATQAQCSANCIPVCPPGGSYNFQTGRCEAQASCPQGTLQSQGCFVGYTCPFSGKQCHQIGDRWFCSSSDCITSNDIQNEPDMVPFGFTEDGRVGANGECLDNIFIFNGKGMRCRTSGVQTGFKNCCDRNRGLLYDNFGEMSVLDLKRIIEGLYGLYQVGKIAKLAYDIGRGALHTDIIDGFLYLFKPTDVSGWYKLAGKYALGTPEASALNVARNLAGEGGAVAADSALRAYLDPSVNPNVALAVTKLAISMTIKDPMLSSLANLVATYLIAPTPLNLALAIIDIFMVIFMATCDQQDILTATLVKSGYCHYVGDRCLSRWPFVGCVQKARVYCCFNSKLARIVHQQGRPQLSTFGPGGNWGDPKAPNCRGFTPDELQALDFERMDFSEYVEDILRATNEGLNRANAGIQQVIEDATKGVRP